jgi:hypothetical protein
MLSQAQLLSRESSLNGAYQQFIKEQEPARKDEAGKKLIRALFGTNAIAEV